MVVMVFDIGDLHMKRRECYVEKRSSSDLLLKDGIGREGNGKGDRGREEKEKKG